MAQEKVTLFGLPIVAVRKVNYSQIDPPLARELFIRHALVEGDWQTRHAFFAPICNCWRKLRNWKINPAAATFWWTMKRCSPFTTSVCRPISFPPAISTSGGNPPAIRMPIC